MKGGTAGLFLILFLAAGTAYAANGGSKIVFQINENSGVWSGDNTLKKEGSQNLVYFSVAYLKKEYGVTFLGRYANTTFKNEDPAVEDFDLSAMLDSTLSGYYRLGIVRAGLDLNLPTGDASFTNAELQAIFLDNVIQDLNITNSFGRGLDISPNLIVRFPLEIFEVGLGLRYDLTGKYDPTSDISGDDFDPGDILTIIGTLQYKPSDKIMAFANLSAKMNTRDRQDGTGDVFKQGNRYALDLRLIQVYKSFRGTYGVSYSIQDKNQSLGAAGAITTEDRNTNNNRYELFANIFYPFRKTFALKGILGYKTVLANSEQSGQPLHDAGYTKIYLGGGAKFLISKRFFWMVDLRLFQISNKKDAQEAEDTNYNGFNFDIGLVYTFKS